MNGLKKLLNFFLIIIGIVFIALCADLIINKTMNTNYKEMDETDRGAVTDVCKVVSAFDKRKGNKYVWNNNYNPGKIGCVILSESTGRLYAVNLNASASVFTQKIEMPDEYSEISVYRYSNISVSNLIARFIKDDVGHIKIKGKDTLFLRFSENSIKLNGAGSLKESYVKNSFADALASPDSPTPDTSSSFEIEEENLALTGLQYRIIDELRSISSKKELDELIAEYVIIRDHQERNYPDFAKRQQVTELTEGRQQYVFYRVSSEIGDKMTYFNKEESEEINFYSAYHYLCTGKYNDSVSEFLDHKGVVYTGAALCEILNNNRIATSWQNKLDNSTNADFVCQYSLIKDYFEKNCLTYAEKKTVDDIKEAYNYAEIMEMAKALVEGTK